MNTIINAILYDRFVGVLIGFGMLFAVGLFVIFFTGVKEDTPVKSKK